MNATYKAITRTAVIAAATVVPALALAGPASAQVYDQHLAVDCPQPFSQQCAPRQGLTAISSPGFTNLFATFTADPNPPACAPGKATIFIDGRPWGSKVVEPGANDGGYGIPVSPGKHLVEVGMEGVRGGCNTGSMSGWSGTLHVETDQQAANR